ncbi:hypothetical protein D3C84_1110060 [compost metagenome]
MKLLSPISLEEIVVRERLEPGSLTYCQTTTLLRVVMDEIVPILGDVTGDCRSGKVLQLNPETIAEFSAFPVLVGWCQP